MSHTCPECGMECLCGGDIDDCCHDFPDDQEGCMHFLKCQEEDDELWNGEEAE